MHSQGESTVLLHHFNDIEQQRSSAKLGMWMFLVTEALFFGGVFVAYTVYRIWYPEAFHAASSKLNVLIAGINSFLLLTSSLTITLAIHAAHSGNRKKLMWYLGVTALLGIGFLCFKAREYYVDYKEHLIPGPMFNTPVEDHDGSGHAKSPRQEFEEKGVNPAHVQLFFMFYYCMTGLHVVHLIVGIGIVLWLFNLARTGWITAERYDLVEVSSLYWHFVDLAWMFLMPLLYLAGDHSLQHLHF